jgi:hypothetical protein
VRGDGGRIPGDTELLPAGALRRKGRDTEFGMVEPVGSRSDAGPRPGHTLGASRKRGLTRIAVPAVAPQPAAGRFPRRAGVPCG